MPNLRLSRKTTILAAATVIAAIIGYAHNTFADLPPERPRAALHRDGITVRFDAADGYTVTVDGIPFISSAQLSLTDPGWHHTYYAYSADTDRLRQVARQAGSTDTTSPARLTLNLHVPESDVALTTQTFQLLPGRRLRISLETRPTTSGPILLENRVASISEAWLSGRPFTATFADAPTTADKIHPWPLSPDFHHATIAAGFQSLHVKTPYGPLHIQTTDTASLALADYRLNPWAQGKRTFWLGLSGIALPSAGCHYQVTFQFPPHQRFDPPAAISAKPDILTNLVTYRLPNPPDTILPTPKAIAWSPENLSIGNQLSLAVNITSGPSTARMTPHPTPAAWPPPHLLSDANTVIQHFDQRWHERFGLHLSTDIAPANTTATIDFSHAWDLPPSVADEAYSLHISESSLHIRARTAAGLRNAFATLEQLFRRAQWCPFPSRRRYHRLPSHTLSRRPHLQRQWRCPAPAKNDQPDPRSPENQ